MNNTVQRFASVKGVTGVVVAVVVAAVCVRLGFWQLSRLQERRQTNAMVTARSQLPPIRLGETLVDDSIAFRRATARGRFDFTHEIVVVGRSVRGVPAVHVVTPLVTPGGAAVLVERGWVPSPDARQIDLAGLQEPAETVVEGIVIAPGHEASSAGGTWPRYVRRVDPVALGGALPYEVVPWVLRRIRVPEAATDGLRPVEAPQLDEGPHLSYAVQWFLFATIAVAGTVVLIRARTGVRDPAGIDIASGGSQRR